MTEQTGQPAYHRAWSPAERELHAERVAVEAESAAIDTQLQALISPEAWALVCQRGDLASRERVLMLEQVAERAIRMRPDLSDWLDWVIDAGDTWHRSAVITDHVVSRSLRPPEPAE